MGCTNNAANQGVCVLHSYESGPESDPAEDELLAGVGGQFVNGLVRSLGEHRQVREVDSFGAVRADKVPFAPPNHADGTRTRSPHRRSARKSPKGRPRRCPPETIRRRMRLSWNEIRVRTASFARKWADAGYEKGDTLVGPREFVVEITWKAINFMLPDESKLRFPKSLSGFLTDKGSDSLPPPHAANCRLTPDRRRALREIVRRHGLRPRRVGVVRRLLRRLTGVAFVIQLLPSVGGAQDALTAEERDVITLVARAAHLASREHETTSTSLTLNVAAIRVAEEAAIATGASAAESAVRATRAQEAARTGLERAAETRESFASVSVKARREIEMTMDERGRPAAWCPAWQLLGKLSSYLDALVEATDDQMKSWGDLLTAQDAIRGELMAGRISVEAGLAQRGEYQIAAVEASAAVILLLQGRADTWDAMLVAVVGALVPDPDRRDQTLAQARATARGPIR